MLQPLPLPLRLTRYGQILLIPFLFMLIFLMFSSIIAGGINLDAYGLTLDSDNNVYIANSSSHSVVKYNSKGERLAAIGKNGDDEGQFGRYDSPRDIAVSRQGTIYAIDYDKSRIEKFDRDGHFLSLWDLPKTGTGRKVDAIKIAVDSREQVYLAIADTTVWKFDSSGNFLGQIGTDLPRKNALDNPWDLTVDANDNLYVGQLLSVLKFDPSGKFITSWEIATFDFTNANTTNLLENVEVDHLGNIYVNNNNIVEKFDINGKFLLSWTVKIDEKFLSDIKGIAVDSENRVYILNTFEQEIEIFDGQGHALNQWSIAWPKWLQVNQPFFFICMYFLIFINPILGITDRLLRKRYGLTVPTLRLKIFREYLIARTPTGRISQAVIIVGSIFGIILGYLNYMVDYYIGGNFQLPSLLGLSIGQANLAAFIVIFNMLLAFSALLVPKKPLLAGVLELTGVLILLALSVVDPLKLGLNVFLILVGGVLAIREAQKIGSGLRPGSTGS